MQFFLDTANVDQIREVQGLGLLDGVTTNPTLLARQGGDWREQASLICSMVDGPVSLEVIATTHEEMIKEAKDLVSFGENVVVKIPMIAEGLRAMRELGERGIRVNATLVFSPAQALLAAKLGATYVSPFVGRLDGLSQSGMECVEQIRTIFDNYDFKTQILVASVRHPMHVLDAALIGADVVTLPYATLAQLIRHPLTDSGLAAFLADWEAFQKG
ncbi:MAG: fructose-6-phosphate aldolase [Pseudodesulfovibrio sp.]|uniref:Probable transaldolase n=1 Tax=Pseudodesulfovibrio aespoeensis (strain ATCC 700646 / DSM 10631 / Aspo-2) TaxID=643562 RepID=E6VZD4_PSEA9|nr:MULTISPECIES: fructose-6-phosphate aldolase [Pseudodesulfovibrio]MBU4190820.1 fructose-6-phosphate aldolase [Pseudomonadota bacterium]ADU64006.1 transaldolase [Pseudodesulfovibrio aespoeensis Aspo-2]MBU4244420.1 fructose-6-phosphate aldolase [Pseudomonadota bacterium]MBU4379739.1 fructose-6-phosphate aldolase [Pseudomonadota bacterium]MBU4475381.1 fructose-6-phosphate aldolase [Pseudomonadota bacterium]